MNTRIALGLGIAAVATLAGCGGGATSNTAKVGPAGSAASGGTTTCQTGDLTLAIGQSEGTAGSVFEALRFTNKGASSCTMSGYPGVSFVTTGSGAQVGAAASRNAQHVAKTVTLTPGASAEAIVQVVDHGNYDPAQCKATDVSGFRVYPPGQTAAAYVPFAQSATACSTDVTQLTVEAVAPTS
jgi:hypothetical protein